ncbi:MAG: acyloxyacyl hydrolase [Crocinitomicaceae bacterium]|nr:acyloxyacyl hydrolase [Flavobacteriales bacterium]NQZ34332.1 acyloxyacyl hydrolase [Crocinitomicaceae bacterium]
MRNFLTLFIVVCSFISEAQTTGYNEVWLEGKFKAGFLAAHRGMIGHLPTEHAFAGELSYLLQSKGQKTWHNQFKKPTYGFTAFFGSVGNKELLGHYFGSYAFMSFPLIKQKAYSFSFKIGGGMGYGTKVYDPEDNILSAAVSTHINAMIVAGVESRFTFGNNSAILGLDMTHFSNGAFKVPNLGLNLPYVSIGYGRRIQKSNYCDTCPIAGLGRQTLFFGAMGIGSVSSNFPTGGKKYPVYALSLFGRKIIGDKGGVEISFDIMSKQSNIEFNSDVPKTQLDLIQLGAFAGFILPLDHLHFVLGMGVYVRDKFSPIDLFYHRAGVRYVFNNGINLGVVLKSHWARADYFEYGIGYTFGR